jgi:hypothetical protein
LRMVFVYEIDGSVDDCSIDRYTRAYQAAASYELRGGDKKPLSSVSNHKPIGKSRIIFNIVPSRCLVASLGRV